MFTSLSLQLISLKLNLCFFFNECYFPNMKTKYVSQNSENTKFIFGINNTFLLGNWCLHSMSKTFQNKLEKIIRSFCDPTNQLSKKCTKLCISLLMEIIFTMIPPLCLLWIFVTSLDVK